MYKNNALIVLIGPSGAGKTKLTEQLPEWFVGLKRITSCTDRAPRPGEVNGVHYHFLTPEEFTRSIDAGEFVEWAQPFFRPEDAAPNRTRYGRRAQDFAPLKTGVCYADMTEHGIRELRRRRFRVICIQIVPRGQKQVRDVAARAAADAERAQIRIRIDHQVINRHTPLGLERALRRVRRLIGRYWQ